MLQEIIEFADRYLQVADVVDYPNALNGLQIENNGRVSRLAAAVDATEATITGAVQAGADLLIVHHGLFWSGLSPIRGAGYRKVAACVKNNLAVYSAHLPLDLHPEVGNNALLARALGFTELAPFFIENGRALGVATSEPRERSLLIGQLEKLVGNAVWLCPAGPEICRRVGIVTGGAGSHVDRAVREGVDTFLTGEGPHFTFGLAQELGVNLIYAGHYATETFGVRALAQEIGRRFGLPWSFIDAPSGL
jgi:dinuclear metal center YbgI/SA1388 family protein